MHFISAVDLGWSLPDGRLLFEKLNFHFAAERIGLVGANGVGKSTLLQILAGHLAPSEGKVSVRGSLSLVPQDLERFRQGEVADAMGLGLLWRAWLRMREGKAETEDWEILHGHWDLEERILVALARAGLAHLAPDTDCQRLSGGELLRTVFAGALLRQADFLILDKPTNHLDASAREALKTLVSQWSQGLLVVSHDRDLLRGMDRIAEMSSTGLRLYGGSYDFYRRTRESEEAAAAATVAAMASSLRKDQQERQKTLERQAKRSVRGAKTAADLGMPKIVLGMMKRQAQESSAKLGKVHAERVQESREALASARSQLREEARVLMDTTAIVLPATKVLLQAQDLNVLFEDGAWLWSQDVNLEIRGPERVGLLGDNGSGKSMLLAMVLGRRTPSRGQCQVKTPRVGLLDQAVNLLNPALSPFENLRAHALESLPDYELRIRLGRFHFPGQSALQPVSTLSGGERMRAGLACLFATGRELELLLLDEPTNNLDLAGQAALESALADYGGALLVVSHDREFMARLDLHRTLTLKRSGAP